MELFVLPSSGELKMSAIRDEVKASNPFSLSQARNLANKPPGPISFSDLRGKSFSVANFTVTENNWYISQNFTYDDIRIGGTSLQYFEENLYSWDYIPYHDFYISLYGIHSVDSIKSFRITNRDNGRSMELFTKGTSYAPIGNGRYVCNGAYQLTTTDGHTATEFEFERSYGYEYTVLIDGSKGGLKNVELYIDFA